MKRLIILKNKTAKSQIIKAFGISSVAVSHALNFKRNSEKDAKIRLAAMINGGKLLMEVKDWNNNLLK